MKPMLVLLLALFLTACSNNNVVYYVDIANKTTTDVPAYMLKSYGTVEDVSLQDFLKSHKLVYRVAQKNCNVKSVEIINGQKIVSWLNGKSLTIHLSDDLEKSLKRPDYWMMTYVCQVNQKKVFLQVYSLDGEVKALKKPVTMPDSIGTLH